jgi:hypothetical protein
MFECDKGQAETGRVPLARLRTAPHEQEEKRERLRESERELEEGSIHG